MTDTTDVVERAVSQLIDLHRESSTSGPAPSTTRSAAMSPPRGTVTHD